MVADLPLTFSSREDNFKDMSSCTEVREAWTESDESFSCWLTSSLTEDNAEWNEAIDSCMAFICARNVAASREGGTPELLLPSVDIRAMD